MRSILSQLEEKRQNLLKLPTILPTHVLNIDDYLSLGPEEKKQYVEGIAKAIKEKDVQPAIVYLCASNHTCSKGELLEIRQLMRQADIPVSDTILFGAEKDCLEMVHTLHDKRDLPVVGPLTNYLVTCREMLNFAVTQVDCQLVGKKLHDEKVRLETKYKNDPAVQRRIAEITKVINEVTGEKSTILSYNQLSNNLHELEIKMRSPPLKIKTHYFSVPHFQRGACNSRNTPSSE